MEGKVCIVTGASSGIGLETARRLAAMGARVVMVGRNAAKTEAAAEEVRRDASGSADVVLGDFASLRAVQRVAEAILDRYAHIDVLISNAGVYRLRRQTSSDGYEEVFAVNHLAAFSITNLLRERLVESAPSRIVIVASDAHFGVALDFDDLQSERRYRAQTVYSRSKLANVMFGYGLARRLDGSGVTVNSLHPGFVATHLGSGNKIPVKPFMAFFRLTGRAIDVTAGAQTPIYLASSPDVEGVSGKYFDLKKEKMSSPPSYDEDAQERLWRASEELVGAVTA